MCDYGDFPLLQKIVEHCQHGEFIIQVHDVSINMQCDKLTIACTVVDKETGNCYLHEWYMRKFMGEWFVEFFPLSVIEHAYEWPKQRQILECVSKQIISDRAKVAAEALYWAVLDEMLSYM